MNCLFGGSLSAPDSYPLAAKARLLSVDQLRACSRLLPHRR